MTEKAECMSESFSCSTFTHPLVLTQNVACGTFTLVRAHHVNTAKGTQQRILGALIDVWNTRQQLTAGDRLQRYYRTTKTFTYMMSHTFTGHHRPRLKAIIACTLKSADDISACAVAARIANVTLISVCIEESYTNPVNHVSDLPGE